MSFSGPLGRAQKHLIIQPCFLSKATDAHARLCLDSQDGTAVTVLLKYLSPLSLAFCC